MPFGFGGPGWGWGPNWGWGPGWGWRPGWGFNRLDALALATFFVLL